MKILGMAIALWLYGVGILAVVFGPLWVFEHFFPVEESNAMAFFTIGWFAFLLCIVLASCLKDAD